MKVLVIDNSQIIRNLLQEYLTDFGHRVSLAVDGLEGIEMASQGDFDLVICDIHMPKRNGYQVFTEVSRKKPELPFVMTDSLPDDLAEQALAEGAYYCLTKPFNLDQLEKILEEILVKTESR